MSLQKSLTDKNGTFQYNHEQIVEAYNEFIDMGIIPTVQDIASRTSLSRQTVYKHLEHLPSFSSQRVQLINLRRLRLIEMLYNHATSSSPFVDSTPATQLRAAELYMKFTDPGTPAGAISIESAE